MSVASNSLDHHQRMVDVSLDLFSGIVSKVKGVLNESFNQKLQTVYHDGEKRLVLEVARDIFKVTVTHSMLKELADNLPTPDVETIGLRPDVTITHEAGSGSRAVMPGTKVAGI